MRTTPLNPSRNLLLRELLVSDLHGVLLIMFFLESTLKQIIPYLAQVPMPQLVQLEKKGRQITIKPKSKNLSFIDSHYKSPGPCAYEALPSINANGKYVYSKFKNSMAIVFNPPRSKRFSTSRGVSCLGPGQYDPITGISETGKYPLSPCTLR
eukprot:TRINITY_DN6010_c0_g3_i1.p1 TRINITY_DN6010_c0_g3~~TRINITY_DN6010_c0_g3_i1.p1  ORF type:complete len:153 (+),score=1.03 TRINITY_DN6010_c0_g3_i1:439-897(+)